MKNLSNYLFNLATIGIPTFMLLDLEERDIESCIQISMVVVLGIIRFTMLEIEVVRLKDKRK